MDPDALDDAGRVPHGSSDDPDVLDFSANINPRTPEGTREVYAAALEESRSYPPEGYPDYRTAAAEYVGCDPGRVVPTAGGLAAIRLAVEATVAPDDSVLVPFPSFGEYAREVRLQGATPAFVPHDELLDADPAGRALAVVCNPNNPTGDAYDPAALRAFADRCREADTPLLVDEAFLGFTDHPSMAGEPGVVVARSLTKLFGLPGLRAGFAVAAGGASDGDAAERAGGQSPREDDTTASRGRLHDRVATASPPWSVGWPAAKVGARAMRDDSFVRETRERVSSERARMRERLATRFTVHPSDAPFLLLETDDVGRVKRDAKEADVAVRDATTFRGLDAHVRVAVRTPAENDRLLEALDV